MMTRVAESILKGIILEKVEKNIESFPSTSHRQFSSSLQTPRLYLRRRLLLTQTAPSQSPLSTLHRLPPSFSVCVRACGGFSLFKSQLKASVVSFCGHNDQCQGNRQGEIGRQHRGASVVAPGPFQFPAPCAKGREWRAVYERGRLHQCCCS